MIRLRGISLAPGEDSPERLRRAAARMLGLRPEQLEELILRRRSVDARNRDNVRLIYTVDVAVPREEAILRRRGGGQVSRAAFAEYSPPAPPPPGELRPVVAGFGPAGMFAALLLAEAGLRPLVLERGGDVEQRREKVRRFQETGELDPECNVQFGEGGAGAFSDGKLNTGTGDRRIGWILRRLAEFGAGPAILSDAAPHVGTDVLMGVVRSLREHIRSLGGDIRFGTRLERLICRDGRLTAVETVCGGEVEPIPCERLILALGHSARDTLAMLRQTGLPMAPKPFSMGVRIEHLQSEIDAAQYGRFAGHSAVGPAAYKLSCRLGEGGSAYTFCMCPGGYVIASASEPGGVVTNGMSYSGRAGKNANAALLVTLTPEMFPERDPLSGVRWQRALERAAFQQGGGNYFAPAQLVGDFLSARPSSGPGRVLPTYRPGVSWCDLSAVLPQVVVHTMRSALPVMGRTLRGFDHPEAVLTAPETRSSSPVRVLRDETLQASIRGLYPCGEGAGYSGGIISSAADGLRCAEALMASLGEGAR